MVKTKEEILEQIKTRLGEDTSDEALSFIEDITDTLTDYEAKTNDTTDWKQKYEDNDKQWRERYKERFFSGENPEEEEEEQGLPDPPLSFDDLFKKE